MERVETLCNLLAEKLQKKASINELLSTVKMMESELLHLKNITPASLNEAVTATVNISKLIIPETNNDVANVSEAEPEKIVEVLKIDEAEVEAELEEIKNNAAIMTNLGYQNRPQISFEGFDEIPTLANRQQNIFVANSKKELNEVLQTNNGASLNDRLSKPAIEVHETIKDNPAKELNELLAAKNTTSINDAQPAAENKTVEKNDTSVVDEKFIPPSISHSIKEETNPNSTKELHEVLPKDNAATVNDKHNVTVNEVSDLFEDAPIKDLKKAIGVNERFLYLNELFRGDEAMYERSIKTINAFSIYPEAEFWIRRELKLKLGWDDKYNTVKQFDQLIRRRFS
jgi:hypothetical protein